MPVFGPKTTIHIAIGLVILEENDQRRLLITQRPPGRHLAGAWEFPGGKIEPDESPQEAVVRELNEELSLTVTAGESLKPIDHLYTDRSVRLHPVWCRPQPPVRILHLEVADHRWADPTALSADDFPPANVPLIRQLAGGLWPRH
ncbi:MAG: (deoxy)nucleoside triphosphate pyrophosphohydrolase [Phycisphaeraceae bacterium]|nr:(deoxy)nucleoside triphosphate pyrophosphohydrolase [Phycisphaeraceae bacterium]